MLHGKNFIGYETSARSDSTFQAYNPRNGSALPTRFYESTSQEIELACQKANVAFNFYSQTSAKKRAKFLRDIAYKIEINKNLIHFINQETGFLDSRIVSERTRTCNQLKTFASLIEKDSWRTSFVEQAQPQRKPLPKPNLRKTNIPIGVVAVFGASNFPLAYSTAGGDTASALAVGCPVVVKAHNFHPHCSEIIAQIIIEQAQENDLPDGVFSMVHGNSIEVGQSLVINPFVKAIGFTGSLKAGRAIYNSVAKRKEPIPVYAEMGSSNPIFLLPEKIGVDGLAQLINSSLCLEAGQFCTNPGMLVAINSSKTQQFIKNLSKLIEKETAGTMVHSSIKKTYEKQLADKLANPNVKIIAQSKTSGAHPSSDAYPTLIQTDAKNYLSFAKSLKHEIFGPCTMLILCEDKEELLKVANNLEGQLTCTLQATNKDMENFAELLDILPTKCGRLILNGVPTGVEVCPAMQHGGPYPATTDVRTTSVGTEAIYRFVRPICHQNFSKKSYQKLTSN